jgi:hypothetical protein
LLKCCTILLKAYNFATAVQKVNFKGTVLGEICDYSVLDLNEP